jgi:hypothetical protein
LQSNYYVIPVLAGEKHILCPIYFSSTSPATTSLKLSKLANTF